MSLQPFFRTPIITQMFYVAITDLLHLLHSATLFQGYVKQTKVSVKDTVHTDEQKLNCFTLLRIIIIHKKDIRAYVHQSTHVCSY